MSDPVAASFEGRPLPKPDEPVVDQGLQFDITTMMGRRGLLALLGGGLGAISLAACGVPGTSVPAASGTASSGATASSNLTEIPDETAGPYPADGSNGPDILEQAGVVRRDIRSSFGTSTAKAAGVPMSLELTIVDMAQHDAPFAGVAVYAWHCTADGRYSLYSDGLTQENYLRGVQVADADGKVIFTSIVPGCYPGRWPHIHFEVFESMSNATAAGQVLAVSQIALTKAACDDVYATAGYEQSVTNKTRTTLQSDMVFGDDGGIYQLATMTGSAATGYTAGLNVTL